MIGIFLLSISLFLGCGAISDLSYEDVEQGFVINKISIYGTNSEDGEIIYLYCINNNCTLDGDIKYYSTKKYQIGDTLYFNVK